MNCTLDERILTRYVITTDIHVTTRHLEISNKSNKLTLKY